jgi:hypothetical protein
LCCWRYAWWSHFAFILQWSKAAAFVFKHCGYAEEVTQGCSWRLMRTLASCLGCHLSPPLLGVPLSVDAMIAEAAQMQCCLEFDRFPFSFKKPIKIVAFALPCRPGVAFLHRF